MPRQTTVRTLQNFAERGPGVSQDIDYDAEYRALDLMPGSSLREIQDRARLLDAAFHPDGLPAALWAPAAVRAQQITRAADRLSRHWRTHGAPPPSGRTARLAAARHADALDRLGASAGAIAAPSALRPAPQRPSPRLHLATESAQPRLRADALPRNGAEPSGALRAAVTYRAAPQPRARPSREPQERRPLAIAAAVLVKLAMVGLVVAAVVRVQQYRADHPSLSLYAEPGAVTAIGMPGEPPVRWAGMPPPSRQIIGAAAPAIVGRQRHD